MWAVHLMDIIVFKYIKQTRHIIPYGFDSSFSLRDSE